MSVAGVVVDDHRRALLVQRRDNGHWEPPGGILELEENVPDGLRREVREETGLIVEPMALSGIYKNMSRGIIALVFRCRALEGTLSPNDEVKAFHWATRDEVVAMLDEAYAVRVLDAMDAATASVAIRHHDGVRLTDRRPLALSDDTPQ
ncbi:NUDIX domain-containing protein [Spirillospora sp. NPDC049652]